MKTPMLPLPIVLLLAAPLAHAQDAGASQAAAPAGGPSDPQEWATFQDTLERYRERMEELQSDNRALLDAQEAAEREKITSAYGNAITNTEDSEAKLRRVAIAKIEAFLAKYPETEHNPDMLFRLADLYFEESEVRFFAEMEDYGKLEAQLDTNPSLALPPEPAKDYARSIDLYKRIISKYPGYENIADTYYMYAWCLSAPNAQQYDPDAARDVYLAIVDKFPHSPFSNDANMRLGEYFFDLPGPREAPTANIPVAIKYYEAVLADGPDARNYDEAVYKLGWSHYKLNEYDKALAYLVQLLDDSDKKFLETGKPSNMRQEAVEYLAISYADIADRQGRDPVEVATAHLTKVGDRKWQHDVMERLAKILYIQAKFDYSIEAYRYLQKKWPLDPNNPVYQYEIAQTYLKMPPAPDLAKSSQAMADLGDWYKEGTAWYAANKSNPDAIAKARGYIETSLEAVANEILIKAQETDDPKLYALAADKYKEFLDRFPFAANYDEDEWYRALALLESDQYVEAERAYLQILKNERSPYRDQARLQVMTARKELILAKYGSLTDVPQGAAVERVDKSAFGKEITRYVITDEQKAFIQIADDLVGRQLTNPEAQADLEKNRFALTYLPAQILYKAKHFDEARPRMEQLIRLYPQTDEAEYAAGTMVNMATEEGDLERVAQLTADYLSRVPPLGKPTTGGTTVAQEGWHTIQEQARYTLCYQKKDKGDFAGAAECYQAFMKDFPKSQYLKDALYATALNTEAAGKAADANKLYEQYIATYPADDASKGLYFRIAGNYSDTLQLDKAISYYEQLAKLFPDFVDTPAALFNAAFLRVGIGDHAGAARTFERYAALPGVTDGEQAYWRAGEQWALVSENDALDFYGRYVKRYPSTDGNHLVEAWYRTAKIYEKRKDSRRAAQAWSQVQSAYGANVGAGLTSRTRSLAAEGALDALLAQYEAFKVVKWTNNEKKDVDILLKQKPEQVKTITEGAVQLIQTYQDYETAAAALYIQGMTRFAFADMAYNIPSPKGLSDEEEGIFRGAIDEQFRIPAEDQGKKFLVAALEKAKAEKRWSEWNTKALIALNERFPSEYPAERKESRGTSSGSALPFAPPATISTDPLDGGTP